MRDHVLFFAHIFSNQTSRELEGSVMTGSVRKSPRKGSYAIKSGGERNANI